MKTVQLKLTLIAFLLIIFCVSGFAQSNDRIDELLLQGQARLDSTFYIVLAAGGLINETDNLETAFQKASEIGLVLKKSTPDKTVQIDELSFILMKSLSLKGGLMYTLFPGPRYAYRDLVFNKVVNDKGGPKRLVSGEEVIRTLGNAFALKGGKK